MAEKKRKSQAEKAASSKSKKTTAKKKAPKQETAEKAVVKEAEKAIKAEEKAKEKEAKAAEKEAKALVKGEEKGYFEYGGSTIVLLFEEGRISLDEDIIEQSKLGIETKVSIGEKIGVIC